MFLFFIIQLKKTFLIIIKRQFLMNKKMNNQCNYIMHLKPFNFFNKMYSNQFKLDYQYD